jgi:hydroxylamine reductase
MHAHRALQLGAFDPEIDAFTIQAIFSILTNVNFDPDRLIGLIHEAVTTRDAARELYERASVAGIAPAYLGEPAAWIPASSLEGLLAQGQQTLLPARFLTEGKEVLNSQELVLYGLKGVAAYAAHALALGAGDRQSFAKIHELLDFLTKPSPTADELLTSALAVGELNYRVMEILGKAHTETFGHPVPSKVRLHARKGMAILVSGHDLHDLYALLEQTKELGIQIYTHVLRTCRWTNSGRFDLWSQSP